MRRCGCLRVTAGCCQPSAGTPLANDDPVQVAPRSAAASGQAMIITGSLITFPDGLRQTAAVWTWPSRSAEWSVTRLPDAGERSEALAARCAQVCWVSGYVDGQVALWQVGTGEPVREPLPGGLPVDGGTRTLLTADGRPGVVFSQGRAQHAGGPRARPAGRRLRLRTAPWGTRSRSATGSTRSSAPTPLRAARLWTVRAQVGRVSSRQGPDRQRSSRRPPGRR